jgi:hypothetical protein
MTYRDDALQRLDVAAFFAANAIVLRRINDTEYRFLCPFHDDREPSANVAISGEKKGMWYCHVCNIGGSPIDLLMRAKGMQYKDAITAVGAAAGLPAPKLNGQAGKAAPSRLSEKNVEDWHAVALRNAELMRWFEVKRGFTADTIAAFRLGWDGERVTIPVRDETGRLVNVRRYLRDSKGAAGKMVGIEAGHNEARLFPLSLPIPEEVVLVEGEWDAILMHQMGFTNTVTVTSGAGTWKPEFTDHFTDRRVIIAYDNDEAGRKGAQRVAKILAAVAQVHILLIPGLPDKGDVTDFFVEQNRSGDELRSLILDATPYVLSAVKEDDDVVAAEVALHAASDARYRGTKLSLSVLLSGKAMTPYTVPYEFEFTCNLSNKRFCGICPMHEEHGRKVVRLSAKDPAVLSLINVTAGAQYNALKELAGAVAQCNVGKVDVRSATNIEELRLIPELDSGAGSGEAEYVNRTGYFLGHGLLANRSYSMIGYSHPHPKTQATVHLLQEAIPAQDNIGAFALTPELARDLAIFRPGPTESVEGKFRAIYDDMRQHVHRIQDRFDMQVAYDLTWHSVLDFYFNGAYTRRGWVESMVMGDSGQGKTEMAMSLLAHYGMGQRVQGEQTSSAGLIGGLEKMGDTWMLSWGRVPLNDKRLIVIDESQGLASQQVEGMSDVRATGVAEITKIRTERTNARCRIVWLANPPSGRTLSQHNQGVLAFSDLFKKPEDIRRLDFGITVASGDVSIEEVNALHKADASSLVYSSALCRSLVLWAWSRRADQVTFTPEATQAILAAATEMGRRYHPAIPLVEPADQRLKLARLACAAAARTYSTDETGEVLVVTPEHVEFVVNYLNRIYNSRSMSYGEYSDQMRGGEVLEESEEDDVRREIDLWGSTRDGAIAFFRQARIFKKSDLVDVVGWEDTEAKSKLRFLASRKCIRATREGYVKQPAFIALLRDLAGTALPPELDDDEAPF